MLSFESEFAFVKVPALSVPNLLITDGRLATQRGLSLRRSRTSPGYPVAMFPNAYVGGDIALCGQPKCFTPCSRYP
jgi:hypothetical protein